MGNGFFNGDDYKALDAVDKKAAIMERINEDKTPVC